MAETESGSKPKPKPLNSMAGILGAIVGVAVGSYSGLNLVLPIVCALAVGGIAAKVGHKTRGPILWAFAIQVGHALWMAIGLVMLRRLDATAIDVVILVLGGFWLLLRPGLGPVLLLSAFQLVCIVVNGLRFAGAAYGSLEHKALLVHLILRVAAVIFMYLGLYGIRKAAAEKSEETSAPVDG